jgi:hypothetical protein
MKVDNITVNSENSFTGYTATEIIHGIRMDGSAEMPIGVAFPVGVEISLQILRNDGQVDLAEGVYLTVKYSVDSDDSDELEFFLQNFFAGFLVPITGSELKGILQILKRFGSKRLDITGLIGELIFLLSLSSPIEGVLAWHITKDSIFDFNFPHAVYEVKCTSSLLRKHKLNHHQLSSLVEIGDSANYVSIIINRNIASNTLQDLVLRIYDQLNEEVGMIFKSKLEQYTELLDSRMKFDIDSTLKSVEVFAVSNFKDLISHSSIIDSRDISFSVNFNRLSK